MFIDLHPSFFLINLINLFLNVLFPGINQVSFLLGVEHIIQLASAFYS